MTSTTDTKKMTLYGAVYCPFVHRARVALAEANVDYEYVIIDTKNKPEWYKEVYPETKIPALTDESGHTLGESLVVAEYVCERFADKNLVSTDVAKRADSRFLVAFFDAKINADYHKHLYHYYEEGAHETYKTEMNAHIFRLNQLLLAQHPTGPYFLGDQFSYADIALAPFILRMHVFHTKFWDGYELDAVKVCPRAKSYFEALVNRPSVQDTFFGDDAYIHMLGTRFKVFEK